MTPTEQDKELRAEPIKRIGGKVKRTSKYGYGRNAYKKPEDRVVGWGKYRGMKMSDVPTDYLKWFVKNAYDQMTARKEYAEQELSRRKALEEVNEL